MAVYILSGARTPIGSFLGQLSSFSAPELGAVAITKALEKGGINASEVNEVFMGQVLQAGTGQAPARQAALKAKLPDHVPCTTINKVCGSGLQSIIMGARSVLLNENDLVVAGGMENMSLSPHLLPKSRSGFKFGHVEMKDSMLHDGLWDPYSDRAMGNCAEECAKKYNFSREEQDAFAVESYKRSQHAVKNGLFKNEIAAVVLKGKAGDTMIEADEEPFKTDFDKIAKLRPAFEKDGTITAANASTINDGAAAVVLGGEKFKGKAKYKILSWASHAVHPIWFTIAPVEAMKKAATKAGVKIEDIGVFEINEAFSVVTMAAMKELNLKNDRVNINGGAVSLGHPIGASGARIVVSLMNAMEQKNVSLGMAAICIGGGEALAMVISKV